MRRIYLESFLGLLVCFMASVFAYEIFVFQLSTDYDYVLQDYEAEAHQQLLENIAKNQGMDAAHQAMNRFAETSRSTVTILNSGDGIPALVTDYFSANPESWIFYDEERDLWFRLAESDNIYHYTDNKQAPVRQKIELEENLLWIFFLLGFLTYSLGHLVIIFRRVKKLEAATLRFAEGDLSSRVDTSSRRAIGTLNQSFNLMADRIQRLIDSNRSLTNAVAHELRTPVFRIQWQAETLKDTPLNSEQADTITSIVEDTEEMEKMVDELLYYAKLDSSKIGATLEAVEIRGFLDLAIARWGKESDLNIHLLLPDRPQFIEADSRLLHRALNNLVRNAFKYTRSQVLIEVTVHKEQLHIDVHDDGDGIAKEHYTHLFDPFYVGDKARNKAKSGHGLGLSIVKKICEQHSASIHVGQSNTLKGARFTLVFPLCKPLTDKPIQ